MKFLVISYNKAPEIKVLNDNCTPKDRLNFFYENIGCRCVDCVCRKIGKNYYDIWVDDEGLLKEKRYICGELISNKASEILVGNIVIAKSNEEGETIGLTYDDLEEIHKYIFKKEYIIERCFGECEEEEEVALNESKDLLIHKKGGCLFYEL